LFSYAKRVAAVCLCTLLKICLIKFIFCAQIYNLRIGSIVLF
jgi:hypothetical protein